MKTYICCDERRRDAVRAQHTLKGVDYNGIDYLEVVNEHMLQIYFIHKLKDGVLEKENVRITGGERICDVSVVSTKLHSKTLTVTLNKPGDYSIYTLSLTADPAQLQLDQLLSSIDFTFDLPTNEIDCAAEEVCVPEVQLAPDIDYLAKDFTSFRQLMLDRLTTLVPQWQERSTADMGVMLVETLAYVADHLSYRQDVIATESYLSTARRRVSARRHARLLDYFTNDGCNARVWVQIQVNKDVKIDSTSSGKPILLLTQIAGQTRVVFPRNSPIFTQAMNTMSTQPTVFEPMENPIWLFFNHNQISFYTWGERECCLPKGCTNATLKGKLPDLQPGDVLIFKEMVNAHTGAEEDAEPAHRHAVRLTKVLFDEDPLGTWPNDQSGAQDGASDLGKTIAEFEIVEDDHLRIEDARMTGMEAGYHVKKQDEWTEEETDTIIHRYLIEQPDKSTMTVEARMRKDDHPVELHLVETGYVVQATYRKETL